MHLLLLNLPFDRPVQRDCLCPHGVKAAYYWPPLDLLLFGASARRAARLAYVDAIAGGITREATLAAIRGARPDAIFTILSSITLESDLALLEEARRAVPGLRIWASGDVVTFGRGPLDGVDFLVKDVTNGQAIEAELRAGAARGVVGASTEREWSIGIAPHELTRAYARSYRMPYSLHGGIASVATNAGCAFSCTFCNSAAVPFRRRALDEVVEELVAIERLGIREVLFRDFTFNLSDAGRLCEEMVRRRLRLRWSCWTTASLVDEAILARMRSAGCYLVCYGAESGDPRVLAETRRPADVDSLRRAVALTRAAGIEVLTSFVVGFPGEDRRRTEALLLELDPDYLSLNVLAQRLGSAHEARHGAAAAASDRDSLLSGHAELLAFRDALERRFFLHPKRLLRYLRLGLKTPYRLLVLARSGAALAARWRSGRSGLPPPRRRA